ncbi:ATP-binding protein [Derxia gummosa]|uniref:Virulence sensor protein BvgS n=1 Tax=Derxia gummosa DSM 723 TaxID=1121388 RepID=A0A8B6X8R5_9BURK|nr:ATP-binding protein [Derxia gummosa]
MFRFLHRARSSSPPDNEIEQASLRIAVSLGIYVCLLPAFFGGEAHPAAMRVSAALLGFLALAFGIRLAMRLWPRCAPWPRLIGNVADVAMTSFSMIAIGIDGAALFFVYLFITIGNGFRFGNRYLDISLGLSLAGFAVVATTEPFWRGHQPLAIGVAIGLTAICLYARTLIRRLFAALERAEVANEAKRRFLSTMTHELRTPLNAIQGMHDLLGETRLDGHQRELLGSIDTAARTMLGLVEDVLDFSKIEAGKVVLEDAPFDLTDTVDGVLRMLAPQATRKGLDLVLRIDPRIDPALRGDAFRLRQVLLNLLGNALKFTEHGRVELSIDRLDAGEDGWRQRLCFSIRDTGIGMTPEALTRIFDSFTQADSSMTRRFGGTGLGTTISRQLVQLFGGELRVESAPGVGSRFWFEIGLARAGALGVGAAGAGGAADRLPSAPAATPAGPSVPSGPAPRCLLVGFSAETVLPGVRVTQVGDIAAALDAALSGARESRPHDLVLVRAGLPSRDLVELAVGLHCHDDSPPLLLFDPDGDERARALCRLIGYADAVPTLPDAAQLAALARRLKPQRESAATADTVARLGADAPTAGAVAAQAIRAEPGRADAARAEPSRADAAKAETARPDAVPVNAVDAGPDRAHVSDAPAGLAPQPAAEPPSLAEQYRAHGGRSGLDVLVADDNPVNQDVERRILELVGCRVSLVADGEQALDAAERHRYDLILLDMNMPGLGGLDVAHMLAHVEAGRPRTPLVMVTANAQPEVIEDARRAGIGHFLSKPVAALRLLLTVAEATRPGGGLPATLPTDLTALPAANDEPPRAGRLIDPVRLDELTRLGPDFVAELGQRFNADNRRLLAAMDRALAEQRIDTLVRLAHELRGVSLTLGATELAVRCEAIETMSLARLRAEGRRLVGDIADVSARVRRALGEPAREGGHRATRPGDPDPVGP